METAVIWITGIPCSGKTTIAMLLKEYYQKKNLPVDVLDGDEIRKTLSSDLGFSEKDRKEHNRRVIFLAKLLSKNGVTAIVPLISPYRETRDYARSQIKHFVEVWTKSSIETCIKRDTKGLYKKALSGEITNLTGLQDTYEEPKNPELTLDTENYNTRNCLNMLVLTLKKLKYLD